MTISFFLAVILAFEGLCRNRSVYGMLGSGSRSIGSSVMSISMILKQEGMFVVCCDLYDSK